METTPELKTLSHQIEIAEQKVESIRKHLKVKTKELDTKIIEDNENLFGERKSEPDNVIFLFSERVNTSQRDIVLNPIKTSLETAENDLKRLLNLKSNSSQIETTGELFY